MREVAQKVGLGSYSRDLVADLCNLAAGGRISPPSEYRDLVRHRVEESLSAPDSEGEWSVSKPISGRKYTKDRQVAINDRLEAAMKYHQNVVDFLDTVDLAQFPGNTPLEQAMSLLKLLSKQQGGQGGGEAGEPLPIFSDNERPEGVAEALNEVMDEVDSLSEEEQDMLDPEGKNHSVMESPEGDGQKSGTKSLDRLKVAEDLVPGADKRVMLDISRKLDQFTKLQVRRQRLVEPDPAGEEVRQRPMKHLGELSRVAKTAWATRQKSPSYFLYQAVSGQLPVRERVTRLEKKQAIFILVDGSGSMRGKKHWKATGVVMNRLKAVLAGDAEVFLSVFDTQLGRVEHAGTPEEARELMKKFAKGNFSGGGTDIAATVRAAHTKIEEMIREGAALYRPEVVVLTDEDTSIQGLKKQEVNGTRVHGFAMEVRNPSLVDFAKSTGGVGIDSF
ncbi:MAG: VWA domain-containing protein [bacterium]|nr:VWA domain-containing protein [bacterium]